MYNKQKIKKLQYTFFLNILITLFKMSKMSKTSRNLFVINTNYYPKYIYAEVRTVIARSQTQGTFLNERCIYFAQ